MILPDLNLLLHAYNLRSPRHREARAWWESCLSQRRQIALPWVAVLGFLRLSTGRHVFPNPLSVAEACEIVDSWLTQPQVAPIHPGHRHGEILFHLLKGVGTGGNLTTDAHLAAIAIEHRIELHTTDSDFSRFPGLRWRNPLQEVAEG